MARPQHKKDFSLHISDQHQKEITENLNASNQEIRLNEAFSVLQISRGQFEKFHTRQLKREYLLYKLGSIEFQFYEQSPIYVKLAQQAFEVILNSHVVQHHTNQYGPHSLGLIELDLPRVIQYDIEPTFKHSRQSVSVFEPKKSGVEPGFLGYQLEDAFPHFFEQFPESESRLEQIRQMQGNVGVLFRRYRHRLKQHVVKLTYKKINESGEVIPDREDLARASTMKNILRHFGPIGHMIALMIYQRIKTRNIKKINCEAVGEVLANDVARALGMEVQNQHLLIDRHSSGRMRLPLKAEWIEGASLLQPLAGSDNNQQYYVERVTIGILGVQYISSKKVKNMPMYFSLLACLGDRDKIGSQGQNMLVKLGRLIGIDFAHAFPAKNVLVDSLKFDFTFYAPQFKNYSIFLDAPRSELMQGVLMLARYADVPLNPEIVRSYGDEFYRRFQTLTVGADVRVFDDYIRKFSALKKENPWRADEYELIIAEILQKKERHIAARAAILQRFAPYLNLPAPLIDTLQNFEKLWAANSGTTSMRSPDGNVMLNHLRVTRNSVIEWVTDTCDADNISVTAVFHHARVAEKALKALSHHQISDIDLRVVQEGSRLSLHFPRHCLPKIAEMMKEERIKAYYHPDDFRRMEMFQQEKQLLKRLEVFNRKNLTIETTSYVAGLVLRVHVKDKEKGEIANFVLNGLRMCRCVVNVEENDEFLVQIPRDKFLEAERFLSVFEACYQHYFTAKNQLEELAHFIQREENVFVHFSLELIYQHGEFKFHLKVFLGDKENIALDVVTEGDVFQTMVQLQKVKLTVLETYENFKYQQPRKVSLTKQVDDYIDLLENQRPAVRRSPAYFVAVDPAVRLITRLKQWTGQKNLFSKIALNHLFEMLISRLKYVEIGIAENIQENHSKNYLVEKEILEGLINLIQQLKQIPEIQRHAEQSALEIDEDSANQQVLLK